MRTNIIVLSVLFCCSPSFVLAQCFVFPKPEEGFARSEVVFLGKVIDRRATGVEGDHVIVDIATFQVQRLWKGQIGREVQVGADRPFERGKQYVVFASGEPLSTTILCRWTELRERAASKLEWLSTRPQIKRRPAMKHD